MHSIHWKKQAINDLIAIGQKIAQDSLANAEKMIALIEKKVTPLAVHPEMGHSGRKQGTRELVAHKNYVVIYRIRPEQVEILRVKHAAQQCPATGILHGAMEVRIATSQPA